MDALVSSAPDFDPLTILKNETWLAYLLLKEMFRSSSGSFSG